MAVEARRSFPYLSSAVIVKPKVLPAVTLDGGWVVITNSEAASGVTVIGGGRRRKSNPCSQLAVCSRCRPG